jgi:hypothetical protein
VTERMTGYLLEPKGPPFTREQRATTMRFHLARRPENPACRRGRDRLRPEVLRLEERALPSLSIQINYDFDTSHFFDTQAKKDAMQSVADQVAATIDDHLAAIVASGTNMWTAFFSDPSTGVDRGIDNLVVPADTLIVYVGGQTLPPNIAAQASPGISAVSPPATPGDDLAYELWSQAVTRRGKPETLGTMATAFAPWGGSISFNTADQFDFGTGPETTPGVISFFSGQSFAAVAWHELGHILGIGTAPSWYRYVTPGGFTGPAADAVYGGPIPLETAGGHWAAGVLSDGAQDLMDGGGDSQMQTTSSTEPRNHVFSPLDYAALEDIGWLVRPPVMAAIPQATAIVSAKHSKKGLTSIIVAFNEALDPGSADNVNLYSIQGGVRKRKTTVYSKPVTIRNVSYDGKDHTVAINLDKPYKGTVRVTVHSGILAASGAPSSSDFSAVVK